MVEQPRINSKMDEAIRKARMSKTTNSTGSHRHYIKNVDKPDRAYTTERAKRAGKANASSSKIFVTTAQDHFGPILPEHDPIRETGVRVGEKWTDRFECRQWCAHLPHIAGIAGQSRFGAQSVALSAGYEDDEDHGDWFLYTGRSHKEKHSLYAPKLGVRYDGIYRIEKCWRKIGIQGKFKVCRYLFVRYDNEPAPWTSDGHGDRPRPLPDIPELEGATDINGRDEQPSWAYDENKGYWKWMREPPTRRKAGNLSKHISVKINRDIMDVIEYLQLKVEEDEEFQDDDQEEDDGDGMEMDEAGCSFNVEEGDNAEDHKDNPADTDADACGKVVVGIKEEGQQPGQKRKGDTDVGTDGRPNKRMATSADVEQQNSKGDEADV
ncbi:unnamed protein product [Miscanthus lutarioriparius]|uniref:YDG domain-containing protein n=1 Tax=Miscanthus lutarioriparius TaxID=422564 RepID=A0A811NQX4_9POAL|nr:unnamed protein product [Miscanthus lutarioriparius]